MRTKEWWPRATNSSESHAGHSSSSAAIRLCELRELRSWLFAGSEGAPNFAGNALLIVVGKLMINGQNQAFAAGTFAFAKVRARLLAAIRFGATPRSRRIRRLQVRAHNSATRGNPGIEELLHDFVLSSVPRQAHAV